MKLSFKTLAILFSAGVLYACNSDERLEAKLYTLIEQVNTENLDHLPVLTAQQIKTTALLINQLKTEKQIWVNQRVDAHKAAL